MKSFPVLTLQALAASVFACVCAFGQTPVFSTGEAAHLVIGQKSFTGADFGASNSLLGSPSGMAYANGVLWVVDSNRLGSTPNNNRILRFTDVSSYPSLTDLPDIPGSTCGACRGTASLVLGQPDFVTTAVNLSASGMRNPTSVATDGNVLAVADTDNNRVLIWLHPPTANGQPADVVLGQQDFTHNTAFTSPTQISLRAPSGVWISNGKLFVADTADNRVLIYNTIPTKNGTGADVVLGQTSFTAFVQPDLTQVTATPTARNMQTPVSVTSDGVHLFVADLAQNRVLMWNSIPTVNDTPADYAIGQPDLTSAVENNSYAINGTVAFDADGNPTNTSPVLCQTTGNDAVTGTALYPLLCAATLSFPRYALSDGTKLFIVDGGNDRVLVFNSLPVKSGPAADIVLGQPDQFSDNSGNNPDGTDAFQTPDAVAYDGTNLYVTDTFNRRVLVHTPGVNNIPLDAVRNAASLAIYAIGSISFAGTITTNDTVTVTVATSTYLHKMISTDTPSTVVTDLATQINARDTNVTASVDLTVGELILTAKVPGAPGGNISYSVTSSVNATFAGTASGTMLNIYLENPTEAAPGSLISVSGTNLCDTTTISDFSQTYLPVSLNGCTLYIDGIRAPLLYISPTQINAQIPFETLSRTSISLYVRNQHGNGSVTATTPIAVTIVPQNPGLFALGGSDPRPGIVYHASSSAYDIVQIDGDAQAGDNIALTIGATIYNYTVVTGDTLITIRDQLINIVNSAGDPNVYAVASNEFNRIILYAITPGPTGEGIAVSAAETTASSNPNGPAIALTVFGETTCCDAPAGLQVTEENPAIPGEALYTFATGLGPTNPSNIDSGFVYQGGNNNPPAVFVDSILVEGVSATPMNVSLVPGTVGVYYVEFSLSTGVTDQREAQMTIAQQLFVSNVVTFPILTPGNSFDRLPPTISSLSPSAGPAAGGTSITITGTNFSTTTSITFGSAVANTFTVNDNTSITVTAPAGTVGPVTMTIVTLLGNVTATYTYQ